MVEPQPIISATDEVCVVIDPAEIVAVMLYRAADDDVRWSVYLRSGHSFAVEETAGALARIRLEDRLAGQGQGEEAE